jgi:phosphoribosyl 1,2-cyclic phosphodiesterase
MDPASVTSPKTRRGRVLKVTFYGVRGSCPCCGDRIRRYGGNTACVGLQSPGEPPLLLDLGTGLRSFAEHQPTDGSFRGAALVSHLHWDHVQGLPFFPPIDREGAVMDVYGPRQDGTSLADCFDAFMRPPYFPVRASDLRGKLRFHDLGDEDLAIGGAKVLARQVPHVGATLGYRVECDGATLAYVSDHQAPPGLNRVDPAVLELCDGVDLLIHDAQYTPAEFACKEGWGHCTVDYALLVAKQARAHRLVLFHHDPAHDDDEIDALLEDARDGAARAGIGEVIAAAEGLSLQLGGG